MKQSASLQSQKQLLSRGSIFLYFLYETSCYRLLGRIKLWWWLEKLAQENHSTYAGDMGRPPCCDKANVKRGLWTPEEDAKILAYVANHGTGNWTLVPKKAGLNRCGKSCRLRWTNYLRPDLKHESFSPQEEDLIIELHKAIGSRWSLIAKRLPGRTDNDVKNYWNTKLKKKLMKMGIDPITHKPFTQIFSDYNNVTSLSPSPSFSYHQPIFNHFQDQLLETHATENKPVGPFGDMSPASSCSSSFSSSMNNALAETTSSSCRETSSFVKAILDRDNELKLDLLALNEFLDY